MPTYKVLAQSAPSAATATTLYTATNATIVSTLNASNIGGTQDTIRIAVRPAGATLASQHYIAYGIPLAAGSVFHYKVVLLWLTQMLLLCTQLQVIHPLAHLDRKVTNERIYYRR